MLAKDQHIDYKRYCFRLSTRDDSKDDRRNDVGPKFDRKYAGNKRKLKRDIKKKQKKNPIDESIIQESYAKQYLKMVCNCIYKKVDESSEDKKEKAYKSFHILSEYLENKGVTGIIYPCTRDNMISGKNLVLFRKEEAVSVENSIREIIY